ncbi:MAG: hypothetical protein ABFE07_07490 [Armatimonadia bacterium]
MLMNGSHPTLYRRWLQQRRYAAGGKDEMSLRHVENLSEDIRQYTIQLVQICTLFVTVLGAMLALTLQGAVQWRSELTISAIDRVIQGQAEVRTVSVPGDTELKSQPVNALQKSRTDYEAAAQKAKLVVPKLYKAGLDALSFERLLMNPSVLVLISLSVILSSVVLCKAGMLYAHIADRRYALSQIQKAFARDARRMVLPLTRTAVCLWFSFHHFVAMIITVDIVVLGVAAAHVVELKEYEVVWPAVYSLALSLSVLFVSVTYFHMVICSAHDLHVLSNPQTRPKPKLGLCKVWSGFLLFAVVGVGGAFFWQLGHVGLPIRYMWALAPAVFVSAGSILLLALFRRITHEEALV